MSFMFRKPHNNGLRSLGDDRSGRDRSSRVPSATNALVTAVNSGKNSYQENLIHKECIVTPVGGCGGGQTQIQRQREVSAAMLKPANKSITQGVISMAEVMKDLQILAEQQQESQQQLDSARQVKGSRIRAQTNLEATFEELKYRNGQERAQLQTWRSKLSSATRSLSFIDREAENSRLDLERVELQLQRTLQTNRFLSKLIRRHDFLLTEFHAKIVFLHRVEKQVEQELSETQSRRVEVKQREKDLYEIYMTKVERERMIYVDVGAFRSERSKLENDITSLKLSKTKLMEKREHIKVETEAEDGRHQRSSLDHVGKMIAAEGMRQKLVEKSHRIAQEISEKKECLHSSWKCLIKLQVAEDNQESLLPCENDIPLIVDNGKLVDSVRTVTKILENELLTKQKIIAEIRVLCDQESQVTSEIKANQEIVVRAGQMNDIAQKCEIDRTEEFDALSSELKRLRMECENSSKKTDEIRENRSSVLKAAREKKERLCESAINLKTKVAQLEQQVVDMNDKIKEKELISRTLLEQNGNDVNMKLSIIETTKIIEELKVDLERDKHELTNTVDTDTNIGHNKSIEQLRNENAKFISDFPCLASIQCSLDPKQTKKEQAKTALTSLHKNCKDRIISAKNATKLANTNKQRETQRQLVNQTTKNAVQTGLYREENTDFHLQEDSTQKQANSSPIKHRNKDFSAAKPRFLLEDFTQASNDPAQRPTLGDDIATGVRRNQVDVHEKKVHWENDDNNLTIRSTSFMKKSSNNPDLNIPERKSNVVRRDSYRKSELSSSSSSTFIKQVASLQAHDNTQPLSGFINARHDGNSDIGTETPKDSKGIGRGRVSMGRMSFGAKRDQNITNDTAINAQSCTSRHHSKERSYFKPSESAFQKKRNKGSFANLLTSATSSTLVGSSRSKKINKKSNSQLTTSKELKVILDDKATSIVADETNSCEVYCDKGNEFNKQFTAAALSKPDRKKTIRGNGMPVNLEDDVKSMRNLKASFKNALHRSKIDSFIENSRSQNSLSFAQNEAKKAFRSDYSKDTATDLLKDCVNDHQKSIYSKSIDKVGRMSPEGEKIQKEKRKAAKLANKNEFKKLTDDNCLKSTRKNPTQSQVSKHDKCQSSPQLSSEKGKQSKVLYAPANRSKESLARQIMPKMPQTKLDTALPGNSDSLHANTCPPSPPNNFATKVRKSATIIKNYTRSVNAESAVDLTMPVSQNKRRRGESKTSQPTGISSMERPSKHRRRRGLNHVEKNVDYFTNDRGFDLD